METVEMDLMQAQIGSLATDVSRLEAKVAKGGGGVPVILTADPDTPSKFISNLTCEEIYKKASNSENVYALIYLQQEVAGNTQYTTVVLFPTVVRKIVYADNDIGYEIYFEYFGTGIGVTQTYATLHVSIHNMDDDTGFMMTAISTITETPLT